MLFSAFRVLAGFCLFFNEEMLFPFFEEALLFDETLEIKSLSKSLATVFWLALFAFIEISTLMSKYLMFEENWAGIRRVKGLVE